MDQIFMMFELSEDKPWPCDDNQVFYGTVAQADDCFGLCIGAQEEHLFGFAQSKNWVIFEKVELT